MSKILITGGAGFIGSHVADRFISLGHQVFILDDLSTGKKENINPEAEFYNMDIRSRELDWIFKDVKFEVVCHHAAQINLRKSLEDPLLDSEINVSGTMNLLGNCVKHKVSKFIFASTGGALYGEQDYFPADEKHPIRPQSPYGFSKFVIERYLEFCEKSYRTRYLSLRYSNVYGPRQNPEGEAGVVAIFCERFFNKREAIINGDGEQTRDYVYVEDVVEANALALEYKGSGAFNIGTGKETTVNTVFNLLKQKIGTGQKEIHGPPIPGEQIRSVLDYSKAKKILGWEPKFDLNEGIEKTIVFYQQR
ncbi:MAG: UDP-glucose 4-epimerase [candidate division Zixibacteria bacterium SM23_73_2]|nr:MAG: UDP-glucose 4-epimerase [candidate division Zixibacteria bacterium SM23_73_2]